MRAQRVTDEGTTPGAIRRSHDDGDAADVRAAQADPARFDVLYRRYLDRVYSYAFYQLGDHHDAEDATERIFLAALRGIGGFEDRGSTFRAWLFTIAHHTIANWHRRRARSMAVPMPENFDHPAPDQDPATLVSRAEELRAVRGAIERLSPDRRAVVLLRLVDGLSSAEVGAVLDRSPAAVRVLLHRALREIAELVNA